MEDEKWYGRDSMRLDETEDRSMQKYLETSSKNGSLVQFTVCSGERIAILPDKVACNRPLRHTSRRLHCESDMCENEGGTLPKRYT